MKSLHQCAIASAIVASVALATSAQPPPNGQGTPGQQQGGQDAQGTGGTAQVFGGVTQTPWFDNAQIRSHLNLTPNQYEQLHNAYLQSWQAYSGGLSKLSNLNDAERAAHMQQLSNSFYQSFNQSAGNILNESNRQRFSQLGIQYRGYQAFADAGIVQQLQLSAEQQRRIALVQQQYEGRLGQLMQGNGPGSDRINTSKQFNDVRKMMYRDIEGVLNIKQRQEWQAMRGNWYDFQPYAGPDR